MIIAILMSTYNGELYLREQINSLLYQTEQNWVLYVRDDGSSDSTISIINDYCIKYPSKIILIKDNLGNLKSASSFMYLLSVVESDYYMFCDQDDVWLPSKIQMSLSKIKKLEQKQTNEAVLVFTDLTVVDSNLKTINSSMWAYSNINPENAKVFYKTCCLNSVTGCTIMFNNSLKEKVLPYPAASRMHDWWISLNAAHFGIVDYLKDTTVLYRQHDANVLGADQTKQFHYFKRALVLQKTIILNIKVLKMLQALNFKKNYFKIYWTKLKIILR